MAESSKVREEQVVASNAPTTEPNVAAGPVQSGPGDKPSLDSPSDVVVPETSVIILERLARQVEYYFSTTNLSKDTYVSTLRSLNEGYVPITIIANFGKVQTLVPYDAVNAVRKAAEEFSDLLHVVRIDTQSGKRVSDDQLQSMDLSNTLEAVGPVDGEAIPMEKIHSSFPSQVPVVKPAAPVQNTLIIREVPNSVEESHIRDLFNFDKCPPVKDVHPDVANCWYVTLDTQSRDDMISVMFELRTKKFPSGEQVQARLKSAVTLNPSAFVYTPPAQPLSPSMYYGNQSNSGSGRKNKKKKNVSKTNGNRTSTTGSPVLNKSPKAKNVNTSTTTATNGSRRNGNGTKQKKTEKKQDGRLSSSKDATSSHQEPPPTLGEEQFPALPSDDHSNNSKIEVEKVPEHRPEDDLEREKHRNSSDSASTATTSSSSSSSKTQTIGGYAAALLKAAPPQAVQPMKENKAVPKASPDKKKKGNDSKKVGQKATDGESSRAKKKDKDQSGAENVPTLRVQPPSWGGGKSFADALRKEAAAAVAASPGQSA